MSDEIPKIFIRVSPQAKKRWMKMCASRGIKQQTAGTPLWDWIDWTFVVVLVVGLAGMGWASQ